MTDDLVKILADGQMGVLATVRRDGRAQLSTVMYTWDPGQRIVRVPTTADRAKAANVRRDPRVALHVAAPDGLAYAVVDGSAELSDVSTSPGDATGREMVEIASTFEDPHADLDRFYARMVAEKRLVIRIPLDRIYGLPPGALPVPD